MTPFEQRKWRHLLARLSRRARNCLARGEIRSFEQLRGKNREELLQIPFLGRITINELLKAIEEIETQCIPDGDGAVESPSFPDNPPIEFSKPKDGSLNQRGKCEWSIYMVRCCDGSLYTGISRNVEKRVMRHNSGKGAVYTRMRSPVQLVYQETKKRTLSEALRHEIKIKRMSRLQKEKLIHRQLRHREAIIVN